MLPIIYAAGFILIFSSLNSNTTNSRWCGAAHLSVNLVLLLALDLHTLVQVVLRGLSVDGQRRLLGIGRVRSHYAQLLIELLSYSDKITRMSQSKLSEGIKGRYCRKPSQGYARGQAVCMCYIGRRNSLTTREQVSIGELWVAENVRSINL